MELEWQKIYIFITNAYDGFHLSLCHISACVVQLSVTITNAWGNQFIKKKGLCCLMILEVLVHDQAAPWLLASGGKGMELVMEQDCSPCSPQTRRKRLDQPFPHDSLWGHASCDLQTPTWVSTSPAYSTNLGMKILMHGLLAIAAPNHKLFFLFSLLWPWAWSPALKNATVLWQSQWRSYLSVRSKTANWLCGPCNLCHSHSTLLL
jgi:hypothetical protein